MNGDKSKILWGSAVSNEIIQRIVEAVQDAKLPITPDEILSHIRSCPQSLLDFVGLVFDELSPPLFITADFDLPLEKITYGRGYHCDETIIGQITEQEIIKGDPAKIQGKPNSEFRIIHYQWMEQVNLGTVNPMGLRHAFLPELLSFAGKEYWFLEKYKGSFKIFALGTTWRSTATGHKMAAYFHCTMGANPVLGMAIIPHPSEIRSCESVYLATIADPQLTGTPKKRPERHRP